MEAGVLRWCVYTPNARAGPGPEPNFVEGSGTSNPYGFEGPRPINYLGNFFGASVYIYIYPGVTSDYKREWSLGGLKGKILYFSRSNYSLWTSRVYI